MVEEISGEYGWLKPERRNYNKILARVWTSAKVIATQNLISAMVSNADEPDPLVALLVLAECTAAQSGLSTSTLLGEMLRAVNQMEKDRMTLTLVHPPEEPNGQSRPN